MTIKSRTLLVTLSCMTFVTCVTPSDARPGGGFSMGSRGSRTFIAPRSNTSFRAMDRSSTPQPTYSAPPPPSYTPRPSTPVYSNPGPISTPQSVTVNHFHGVNPNTMPMSPSSGSDHSFLKGVAGGVVGSVVGNALMNHGDHQEAVAPQVAPQPTQQGGGFAPQPENAPQQYAQPQQAYAQPQQEHNHIGLVLLLLFGLFAAFVGFLFYRKNKRDDFAAGPSSVLSSGHVNNTGLNAPPVSEMTKLILALNEAWNAKNLSRFGALCTSEMEGYLSEQLTEYDNKGLTNQVRNVSITKTKVLENWREGNDFYTTLETKTNMKDATFDANGTVVEGSKDHTVTITQAWTFKRTGPAGTLKISAIQERDTEEHDS